MKNNLVLNSLVNSQNSDKLNKVFEALKATEPSTILKDFSADLENESTLASDQEPQKVKRVSVIEQQKTDARLRSLRQKCYATNQAAITKRMREQGMYQH